MIKMPSCVVDKCRNNTLSNHKKDGITFHRFPQDQYRCHTWSLLVQKQRHEDDWEPSKQSVICSTHFSKNDFYLTKAGLRKLNKNATPTFKTAGSCRGCAGPSESSEPPKKSRRDDASDEEDSDVSQQQQGDRSQAEESEQGPMRVSANLKMLNVSQKSLKREIIMDLYTLSDKIQQFIPEVGQKQFTLHFKGEDGDKAEYIFMSASQTRRIGLRHTNMRCNVCSNAIVGSRFKCVVCDDFDLCASCEALNVHPQHVMLRISNPIKTKRAREMLRDLMAKMKVEWMGEILEEHVDPSGEHVDPPEVTSAPTSPYVTVEVPPAKCKGKGKAVKRTPVSVKRKIRQKSPETERERETADVATMSGEETEKEAKELEVEIKSEPDVYDSFSATAEPTVQISALETEDPDPLGGIKQEEPMDTAQPTVSSPWSSTVGTSATEGLAIFTHQGTSSVEGKSSPSIPRASLIMAPDGSVIKTSSSDVRPAVSQSSSNAGIGQQIIALTVSNLLRSGTTLPAGTPIPHGIILPQGFTLPQGVKLIPGTKLKVPVNLPPGTLIPGGLAWPPGFVLPNPKSAQPASTATTSTSESSFLTYTHSKRS